MTKEKLIPELRFPEFKGEWEKKKLGEVVNFKKGKGIPKRELSDSGKKCILYGELYTKYNEIINEVDSYTRLDTKKLRLSKSGDILIPSSGETALDMSLSSALLLDDIALGGDINILRPKKKLIDSVFLSYQINTARKLDLARKAEGASVVHLYNSNLEKLKISYPSIKEQYKIANFFSSIDKKIQLQEELIDNLEEQKKGLMQKIFNQEVRFKDENGKDYPEWEEKKLDDLIKDKDVKLGRGDIISKKDIEEDTGTNPVYSSSIFKKGLFGKREKYMFDEELITWSIDGGGHFFYRPKHKFSITNVSGYMKLNINKLNYKFISEQLQLLHLSLRFDYTMKAHPSVIRDLYVLSIPTLSEQNKIAELLFSIDKKIDLEKEQLENYKEYKKGLMQRMFI